MTKSWEKYIEKNQFKKELYKIISDISSNNLLNYDVKKLNGYDNLFKIRKGKIRIVFYKKDNGNEIYAVDTRGDIYKGL